MKKAALSLIVFFSFNAILYSAFAFVKSSFNPTTWGEDVRFIYALIGFLIGLWAALGVFLFSDDK